MLRPRCLVAAVAALLLPSVALASPPDSKLGSARYFSLPLLFGADGAFTHSTTSTGFFWGARPEYVLGWTASHPRGGARGFGVGPYAELAGSTGTSQVWLGGGGTFVGYFGHLGIAASAGLDADWVRAVPDASAVFGLFAGFRTAELGGMDLPFGLRVDFRPAMGDVPTTVIVSAQLDLLLGGGLAMVAAVMPGLRGFD